MAKETKIQWCDSTFNPWWGCFPVSPGCANCYAEAWAKRTGHGATWEKGGPRRFFGDKHWNQLVAWDEAAGLAGERRRVFTGSMCDVLDDHPQLAPHRERLWLLMEELDHLDFLMLTKRPQNASLMPSRWLKEGLPPNVWFGFTAEDQPRFDDRMRLAARVPATVRWCSYEPALSEVNFQAGLARAECQCRVSSTCRSCSGYGGPELDWIIAGGESIGGRACHLKWIRSAIAQGAEARVPIFVKQLGSRPINDNGTVLRLADRKHGGAIEEWPEDLRVRQLPEVA